MSQSIDKENDIHYCIVAGEYKDQVTKRNNVPLINHINEGIEILVYLDASIQVQQAYCLHPMLQSNDAFLTFIQDPGAYFIRCDYVAVALALEYRGIANSYLSNHGPTPPVGFKERIIPEVRLMLIADKLQNYKDFLLYHKDSHPKSKELEHYFQEWLVLLDVPEDDYSKIVSIIKKETA